MGLFSWLKAALVREETLIAGVAILATAIGTYFDAVEIYMDFAEDYEHIELDELFWAVMCAGLASLVFFWRRGKRLNQQMVLRAAAEQDVAFLALHDPLTRMPNRRFLETLIRDRERSAATVGFDLIFAVDLDGFKQVNTLIGHAGGDAILRETAQRLNELCGPEVCVRVGGDEFMIIADSRRVEDAVAFAQKVIVRLSEPIDVAGVRAQVGACVGIARTPQDTADLAEAVTFADTALYAAKRSGRGSVTEFHREMSEALKRRSADEAALRAAIAAGEITPHYQPLHSLETDDLIGFEALARWTKATGEQVPPTEFIALAEELGLIVELSDHLLRLACLDASGWPKHLRLSFNISPLQFEDRMLAKRMMWILDACDFDPSRLQVEITETALATNTERAAELIAEMRGIGMRIALDDFGTGYSSLAQLTQHRFDAIKIDRSFISAPESDTDRREIVRAIVGLGHGLRIPLTAEGIEDEVQMGWLKELGCEVGQGYLLGRPVPADAAARIAHAADAEPRRATG